MSDGTDSAHRPKREIPFPKRLVEVETVEDMRGRTSHGFPEVWELCDSYAAARYRLAVMEVFFHTAKKYLMPALLAHPKMRAALEACDELLSHSEIE